MSNLRRTSGAAILAGALILVGAGIASATVLDLTTAGASGSIGSAFFIQIDPPSTGTGVVDPFLRLQASGPEQGVNSDGPYTMNEKVGFYTHKLLVSDFEVVDVDGTPAIRFLLDINELSGSSLLSLDMLKIYVSPTATYNTLALLDANATKLYDMDLVGGPDNWVKLDYNLNPGSETSDMFVYLPYDIFVTHSTEYLYLYSRFGDNFGSDDGYEQWLRLDSGAPALPEILSPSNSDCWLTGTDEPKDFRVAWTLPSSHVDHLDIRYSPDGVNWPEGSFLRRRVDADSSGEFEGSYSFPESNSTTAKVRLECYAADNTFIDYVDSESFALANVSPIRLAVDRNWQLVETPPVLRWDSDPAASSFTVTLRPTAAATSCDYYDISQVCDDQFHCYPEYDEKTWSAEVDAPRNWQDIPTDVWLDWPAGEYEALVTKHLSAGGTTGPSVITSFLKANLSDLNPSDVNEDNPPVVLVHGRTDDSSLWYEDDGSSDLIEGLINSTGLPTEKFHPWAFEYPNIGSIRTSAAALDTALDYLGVSPENPVSLIAHSMGGLVARALLQGYALKPRTGDAVAAPSAGSVPRLATLATPHLGADLVWLADLDPDCPDVGESASGDELPQDSDFIKVMNGELPGAAVLPAIDYFFAAGTERRHIFDSNCKLGNDRIIDVCSARGDCTSEHETQSVPFDPDRQVLYGNYDLDHGEMGKPVIGETNLLADLLGFIRCGMCFSTALCPAPRQISNHDFFLTDQVVHAKPTGLQQLTESTILPAVGIIVDVCPLGGDPSAAGTRMSTDLAGVASVGLASGTYDLYFSGMGYEARHEVLQVTSESADSRYEFTVTKMPDYTGPTNPYAGLQSGLGSSPDSVLHLALICFGASEMRVTVPVTSLDTDWIPYQPSLDVSLGTEAEPCQVIARFRNAMGQESDPVSCLVSANLQTSGGIQVDSTPSGAAVLVDGRSTGLVTPALLSPLAPGYHYVSASLSGYRSSPGVSVVTVESGQNASASFALTASAPPSAALWQSPVPGGRVGPNDLVSWLIASDPDPEDQVFYNLAAYSDSGRTDQVWTFMGVSGTSALLPSSLPDSGTVYLTVASVDTRGVPQGDPAAMLPVLFDRTAPTVTLVTPAAGDTVGIGFDGTITVQAEDWSPVDSLCVLLSYDAGDSYPDTLYAGPFTGELAFPVPWRNSNECVLRASVTDAVGNVGTDASDSLFTMLKDVTAVDRPGSGVSPTLWVSPNPARRAATVHYSLTHDAPVQLCIYDLAGRRVRTLRDGDEAAGAHVASWDGRGDQGALAARGIYFVRLQAGNATSTRRLVLID